MPKCCAVAASRHTQRIEIAHAIFPTASICRPTGYWRWSTTAPRRLFKATVYNTLNLFLEKQLIREVIVDPSKVFYDPNTEPHHHFYNVDTGELTDIDARGIRVTGLPALPRGMATAGIDIIVRIRSMPA